MEKDMKADSKARKIIVVSYILVAVLIGFWKISDLSITFFYVNHTVACSYQALLLVLSLIHI